MKYLLNSTYMQIYQEMSVFKFNPHVEFEASYSFKFSPFSLAYACSSWYIQYVLLLTLKWLMN